MARDRSYSTMLAVAINVVCNAPRVYIRPWFLVLRLPATQYIEPNPSLTGTLLSFVPRTDEDQFSDYRGFCRAYPRLQACLAILGSWRTNGHQGDRAPVSTNERTNERDRPRIARSPTRTYMSTFHRPMTRSKESP